MQKEEVPDNREKNLVSGVTGNATACVNCLRNNTPNADEVVCNGFNPPIVVHGGGYCLRMRAAAAFVGHSTDDYPSPEYALV